MIRFLIFGNGVSMKYAPDEYSNKSLQKKFIDGLQLSNKIKNLYLFEEPDIKSYLEKLVNDENFNESTFFKIYRFLVLKYLEKYSHWKDDFKDISPEELWNKFYRTIANNQTGPFYVKIPSAFTSAYSVLNYAICRTFAINKEHDNWIKINYEPQFINFLSKNYESVLTTNYYIDELLEEEIWKIKFLHGKINLINNFQFLTKENSSEFENSVQMGYELSPSNIIYGNDDEDKVFLRSICQIKSGNLKRNEIYIGLPTHSDLEKIISFDIIGLSTQGDKHIIREITKYATEINIYCYTLDDYKEWKKEMNNFLNKCNFFCSHTYKGFENKTKNFSCPKLCENLNLNT